jgi:hypothetical protein
VKNEKYKRKYLKINLFKNQTASSSSQLAYFVSQLRMCPFVNFIDANTIPKMLNVIIIPMFSSLSF